MRDLIRQGATHLPKGIAFEIADLLLISKWAELRDSRMLVCLDHGTDGEEYEEVIAFQAEASLLCQFIMWREADSVVLQPLIGLTQRYASVAEVLESIALTPRVPLTDVTATTWPADWGRPHKPDVH
jgi:hypothetical protein